MPPVLEIRSLDAGYDDVTILRDINLTVAEGEIVALVGANGAGKTTLLRVVSGLIRPRRGQIHFRGADVTGWPAYSLVGAGLVHVPEIRSLFGSMTVMENLQLGAYTTRRQDFSGDLAKVFDLFPVLSERANQKAATLSGGQQQMLAIARGLMARPSILFLDEASLGLAPIVVSAIYSAVKEIRRRGTTVFLVEQNIKQALEISDRGYVIANGRITHTENSANLLRSEIVRHAYLGLSNAPRKEQEDDARTH